MGIFRLYNHRNSLTGFAVLITALLLGACTSLNPGNISDISTKVTRKDVDFNSISWFAKRARAAYSSESEIKRQFAQTRYVNTSKGSDVQYFLEIFPKRKMQLITIRGSANLKNAIEDIEYTKISDNKLGIEVHKGFHQIAEQIYQDLKPHLKPDYTVAATGHSLGAATGIIVLMYLTRDGFTIAPSSNFGQPRVTNSAGAQRYADLPITRVIDANDAVPMFPVSMLLKVSGNAYEHIGPEIILLKSGHFVYLDKHAANRISVGEFRRNFARAILGDHSIKTYIRKISELEKKAVQVSYKDRQRYER